MLCEFLKLFVLKADSLRRQGEALRTQLETLGVTSEWNEISHKESSSRLARNANNKFASSSYQSDAIEQRDANLLPNDSIKLLP